MKAAASIFLGLLLAGVFVVSYFVSRSLLPWPVTLAAGIAAIIFGFTRSLGLSLLVFSVGAVVWALRVPRRRR